MWEAVEGSTDVVVPERFPAAEDPVRFERVLGSFWRKTSESTISHRGRGSREHESTTHSEPVLAVRSVPDDRVLIDVRVSSKLGRVAAEDVGKGQPSDDETGPATRM